MMDCGEKHISISACVSVDFYGRIRPSGRIFKIYVCWSGEEQREAATTERAARGKMHGKYIHKFV